MQLLPLSILAIAGMFLLCESDIIPGIRQEVVVGGEDAVLGQFPYAVALFYQGDFICTSSIIGSTTILTAAHCVVLDGEEQSASLYHGIANVDKSATEYRIEFVNVTVHPGYDSNDVDNDLAIFRTTASIPFDGPIPIEPVCIARADTPQNEYRNATALGWGLTEEGGSELPDNLQYAEVNIIPNFRCGFLNPGIDSNKICAKGDNFEGVCSGDSGGPLVHLSADKRPVEIGVASYINAITGCGGFAPSVYTRVSKYINFITEAANGDNICTV